MRPICGFSGLYYESSFQIQVISRMEADEVQQQLSHLLELADEARKEARKHKLVAAQAVHKLAWLGLMTIFVAG